MDAYTSFAQVYDLFMDNVPYDEWCAYICETLKKHGIADGPVLDLGCGTGASLHYLEEHMGLFMQGVEADASLCDGQSAVPVTVSIMCLSHRNFPMHSGGLPPVWKAVEYLSLI